MHELLAISARVSSSPIIDDYLLLLAILGKQRLLETDEEGHEVLLVGRRSQLHHSAVLQTLADRTEDSHPHLSSVLHMEHWLVLLGPAFRLHLDRGVRGFVQPDELLGLRLHKIANQTAKGASLSSHSLRLVYKLSIDGLSSAELDTVLLVEPPHCVRRDGAIHVLIQQVRSLNDAVGRPSLHHFIREEHLLDIIGYAVEVPHLLLLEQRVETLAAGDKVPEHAVHCAPRDSQFVTDLSHCLDLPLEPADGAIGGHNDPTSVLICQPRMQPLAEGLNIDDGLLARPPGRPSAELLTASKLLMAQILASGEVPGSEFEVVFYCGH